MKKSEIYGNKIRSYIVRPGMTMRIIVVLRSAANRREQQCARFSGKRKHGFLRFGKAVVLIDTLGCESIYQKSWEGR